MLSSAHVHCLLRALLFLLCLLLFPYHHRCPPHDNGSRPAAPHDPGSIPNPSGSQETFPISGLSLSLSRDPRSSSHSQDWGRSKAQWQHLWTQEVPERQLRLETGSGLERGGARCMWTYLTSSMPWPHGPDLEHFFHLLFFSNHLSGYKFTFLVQKWWSPNFHSGIEREPPEITYKYRFKDKAPSFHKYS